MGKFELPDDECVRLTHNEMAAVLMILNAFSLLMGAEKTLNDRFEAVPDGLNRFRDVRDKAHDLLDDIIGTISDSQRKRIRGVMKDYEIRAVPKLTPESRNVIMEKDVLEDLVDSARDKCVGCVEDGNTCRKCRLYKFLEAYAPLGEPYKGWLCPYANAEWE